MKIIKINYNNKIKKNLKNGGEKRKRKKRRLFEVRNLQQILGESTIFVHSCTRGLKFTADRFSADMECCLPWQEGDELQSIIMP